MNNGTIRYILTFSLGAAVGAVVSWRLLKKKYEQIAQEEIDSVKEVFSREAKSQVWQSFDECEDEEQTDIQELEDKIEESGYVPTTPGISKTTKTKEIVDWVEPYVITPEVFGEEDDYETRELTYYADRVLTDEDDNVIDDPDNVVGPEAWDNLGVHEPGCVHIRNENEKIDYEILYDLRRYSDIYQTTYPPRVED